MKVTHISWNLAGLGLPLVAAVVSIPHLLRLVGSETFGLLSLAWSITALSGLFDLGLGRATTRIVADMKGRDDWAAARATVRTALKATWAFGCIGCLLFLTLSGLDLATRLKLQATSAAQIGLAMAMLAPCVPCQAAMATYRGVSEGLHEFRGVSVVRMAVGAASFLAPWAMALIHPDIVWLTLALLLTRLVALLAFRWLALRHLNRHIGPPAQGADGVAMRRLVADGGWLSVSAVASPLLVQGDRFLIASTLSAATVTVYSVPFDLVTQLLVLVSAVATVAYPSFATALGARPQEARVLFRRWLLRIALGMAMVCAAAAACLPWFMTWWIGPTLHPESIRAGQWLCLGVWVNALGAMFLSWHHAHSRYRLTATLHLFELPLHLLALLLLLPRFGVAGAAMAWTLRVSLDALLLGLASRSSALLDRHP
jgi:O-antigen/teichoic acid export membrane protein